MKLKLTLLFIIIISQFSFSQENREVDNEIDEIIDNIISLDDEDLIDIIKELEKYQIILLSSDFNAKTFFLGRDLGIDQYNITTQALYENSNGIFASVSGTFYSEFDPKWDITVLTAGYGKNFGKHNNFRFELGYSRYIFSDPSSNDFENSINGSVDLATKNNAFGTSLSTSYLFGEKTGFQSNISIYGDIKLFDLNTKSGSKVTFGPTLSFLLGSENIDTSRIDNLGADIPFINRIIDSFETFSLRNTQLQIPITFEFNQFFIETGYNFNFPNPLDFERNLDNTSFFNLRLSYYFSLK